MSWRERMRRLENRLYAAIRHPSALAAADQEAQPARLDAFDGQRHCLVISYRRGGQPVATPVWFALDGERLVFESDADSAKVKRIRRDPRVRVTPCTARGRPLAAPVEATARVLDVHEGDAAERALDDKYGRARRATMRLRPSPEAGSAYVEVRSGGV